MFRCLDNRSSFSHSFIDCSFFHPFFIPISHILSYSIPIILPNLFDSLKQSKNAFPFASLHTLHTFFFPLLPLPLLPLPIAYTSLLSPSSTAASCTPHPESRYSSQYTPYIASPPPSIRAPPLRFASTLHSPSLFSPAAPRKYPAGPPATSISHAYPRRTAPIHPPLRVPKYDTLFPRMSDRGLRPLFSPARA